MLRDYQTEIIIRVREAWQHHRSVMVQMPTGTGKTHVLASVVKEELAGSIWIIAHRRELVAQIEETLGRYGISIKNGQIRVMSIQWLSRHWEDVEGFPEWVIIDEAHHAIAETYKEMWNRWPKARFLGLTATPCRMNRRGFTDLFDTLITSWGIAEFIEKGYLSVFDYVAIRKGCEEQRLIDSLEKRGVDGDYQVKEMNRVLNRHTSIERLYMSMNQFADGKKGIVYAICIEHARRIAEYYSRQGVYAMPIDSKTPPGERKRMVEDFKVGKIRVLVNVDIFSEGFDCPDVEFVQMARPTLSLAKYLQQVGRGLRKSGGKETCVLIDNVGLCYVFGLPTVAWDWEAMFRGFAVGRGKALPQMLKACAWPQQSSGELMQEYGMEVVISHEQLLQDIGRQKTLFPIRAQQADGLGVWQDERSGLWGLKRGDVKVTEARYITVFDIRYDMAAVRFMDKSCGLVDATGDTVWEKGYCLSLKFTKNHFLVVRTSDDKRHYVDLHSLRMYEMKPEIKCYGDIELLKVGHTYYSRTRNLYVNNQHLDKDCISFHKFYVSVFDYKAPASCCMANSCINGYRWGYACILRGDYESFYWIYRKLADGGLIVTDNAGRFYHAVDNGDKRYMGCCDSAESEDRCREEIERITRQAKEVFQAIELEKAGNRQQLLGKTSEAVPFRSGMRWGLKVGNRITVPPIYRNIKSPVGKYCAVEKNYSQWGVISLDGTLMVEPKYSDIEINVHGTVTGTKVTGSKVYLKLP